jgi:hypothetical protein
VKFASITSLVFFAFLGSIAQARAIPLHGEFTSPDGQRQVGNYVFVWRSASITTLTVTEIEAQCPTGDVVLAGGYQGTIGAFWGGFNLYASEPSSTFDGWVIEAIGTTQHRTTMMTVYATCVPKDLALVRPAQRF